MAAHIITTEPIAARVRAEFDGVVLADSTMALLLRETGLPPMTYFPPDDVNSDRLTPTHFHTTCPFKGEASYWSATDTGPAGENLAWGYLEPKEGREDIRGHLAFFRDRVQVVEVA